MSEQNAKEKKLEAIKNACVQLRASGADRITVSAINRITGISRPSLRKPPYSDLIATFVGEPAADAGSPENVKKRSALLDLAARVTACEKNMDELDKKTEGFESTLLEQLYISFKKNARSPHAKAQTDTICSENAAIQAKLEDALAELEYYRNEAPNSNKVKALFRKLTHQVIVDNADLDSIDNDGLFLMHEKMIEEVITRYKTRNVVKPTLFCFVSGMPSSGKSTWIDSHRLEIIGTNVYIEGPFHTRTLRRHSAKAIRQAFPDAMVACACTLTGRETCESTYAPTGKSEHFFKLVCDNYARVDSEEDFDIILPIQVKHDQK
jgi:hypothetical protein